MSHMITAGIGEPSSISSFLLFGLNIAVAPDMLPPFELALDDSEKIVTLDDSEKVIEFVDTVSEVVFE